MQQRGSIIWIYKVCVKGFIYLNSLQNHFNSSNLMANKTTNYCTCDIIEVQINFVCVVDLVGKNCYNAKRDKITIFCTNN